MQRNSVPCLGASEPLHGFLLFDGNLLTLAVNFGRLRGRVCLDAPLTPFMFMSVPADVNDCPLPGTWLIPSLSSRGSPSDRLLVMNSGVVVWANLFVNFP